MALAFIGWAGLSLVNATSFSSGFFDLLRTVKFYLLYLYAANNVRSKATLMTLVTFFLAGMIFQGVLCMSQYVTQDVGLLGRGLAGKEDLYADLAKKLKSAYAIAEDSGTRVRASGTVGLSNAEAQYFEFLLPLSFLLLLAAPGSCRRSFVLAAFCVGLLGLIVTFSRGGLIGFAVALAVILFLARRFELISGRKVLTMSLVGLAVCVIVSPLFYHFIMTRPEAGLARLHLAEVGIEMIKSHPILGVGLNNHILLKPEYDPRSYIINLPTHNSFLIIASEVGIPGLIFFIGFLYLTVTAALKGARMRDPYVASVAVGIVAAVTAIGVHVQVDYIATNANFSLLWLYAGLAAAISRPDMKT
jgi:O-antigen ligase